MIAPRDIQLPSTPQGTRKGEIMLANKDFNRTYSKKKVGDYSYYLNDLIGSGFSSQVFKCHHKEHRDQMLAIKVIKMSRVTKANYHLLQNEINILKGLDHPNIIRFHEVHYTENNCYLITDFCEGGTLQDRIERFQPIDWQDLMGQLIQGCKYLTQKLIIHRDIKPANVFLKNGQWKIGDFGFARYVQSKQTLVKEVYKVGSPLYMPPETLNSSIYSLKTDSFALGILIYHTITKQYPWPGSNKKQLLQLFQTQPFPLHKLSHIPATTQEFIKGLCNVNVNERLFITDFKDEELGQTPIKHHRFCVSRLASLQTCSGGSSQAKEEQNQSINTIFKQINELDIIQRIKLCKFVHYVDANIGSTQGLQVLRVQIKRLLKMILVIFGWTKQAAYQKYVEQFECQKHEQFEKMIEVKQLCDQLYKQASHMKAMEDNRRLRVIRVKFIQLVYILKLVLKKEMGTAKEFISRIILHPDFSKVFMSQDQVEEIQRLIQNYN